MALHISEAVDVCLLELGMPTPRQASVATAEPAWLLSIGVLGAFAANGLSLRPGVELSLDRKLTSLMSLEWVFNTAPWGPSFKANGESLSLGYVSSSLWLFLNWKVWKTLRPAVGAGGGAFLLWSDLKASTDFAAERRTTWKGYLGVNARLGWDVSERVRLQAGVRVGTILPQIVFRLENQTARTVSPVFVEAIVSVGWAF
jgi:hypothetical protein